MHGDSDSVPRAIVVGVWKRLEEFCGLGVSKPIRVSGRLWTCITCGEDRVLGVIWLVVWVRRWVLVSCGVTLNVIAHDLVSTNSKEQPSPSHQTVTNSYIVCVTTSYTNGSYILLVLAVHLVSNRLCPYVSLLSNHILAFSGALYLTVYSFIRPPTQLPLSHVSGMLSSHTHTHTLHPGCWFCVVVSTSAADVYEDPLSRLNSGSWRCGVDTSLHWLRPVYWPITPLLISQWQIGTFLKQ